MCGKEGWVLKWKESKRKSEERKFEKLRIKFKQNKEGRAVTMVGASKNERTENRNETEVDGRTSPPFKYC